MQQERNPRHKPGGAISQVLARLLAASAALALTSCASLSPSGPNEEQILGAIHRAEARALARQNLPSAKRNPNGPDVLSGCLRAAHRPTGSPSAVSASPINEARLSAAAESLHDETIWATVVDNPAADQPATTQPAAAAVSLDLRNPRQVLKHDLKNMPKNLWNDAKKVFTNRDNLVVLLIAGGASLALRPEVDDDIEDKFDRARAFRSEWGDLAGVLGNPGLHLAAAGLWYLAGLQMQDVKTYEVGKTLFSAIAINGLTTLLLQVSAHTRAPNGELLAWPSGHTSSAFCFASVMDEAYGHWVGWPLYGIAGFVAFERLDDREHHFSDVVFGAALGWVIGHTVASGHAPEIFGGRIAPYADPVNQTSGIAWIKSIK